MQSSAADGPGRSVSAAAAHFPRRVTRRGSVTGVGARIVLTCAETPVRPIVTPKSLCKGHEYARQRCAADPRHVVQRDLVDEFLAMYLPMVDSLHGGHPLGLAADGVPLPAPDFGSLISATKVAELKE